MTEISTRLRDVTWWLPVAGVISLLLIWEGAAHLLLLTNPNADTILPTIESVLLTSLPGFATFQDMRIGQFGGTFSYLGAFDVLARESLATMGRVLFGTSVGILLGITVGFALSWSAGVRTIVSPFVHVLRLTPFFVLIPLFQVWFGTSEIGVYVYITFAVFTVLVVNTIEAVRNVPPIYAQFAATLGASRAQIFRTVYLPAAFPGLVGAIRVTLGIAWSIALASEFLAVRTGLGRLLVLSSNLFFTGRVIVVLLLFMVYSVLLVWAFLLIARRITRWMPSSEVREASQAS